MRLVWVLDAKLPPPLINQPIWDLDGRLLAIVDLLDPESGTVGEYDGADHLEGARRTRDVAREHLLREAGLEFFVVTGGDMGRSDLLAHRMHAVRARARWRGPDRDGWTITPPPWWTAERRLAA